MCGARITPCQDSQCKDKGDGQGKADAPLGHPVGREDGRLGEDLSELVGKHWHQPSGGIGNQPDVTTSMTQMR